MDTEVLTRGERRRARERRPAVVAVRRHLPGLRPQLRGRERRRHRRPRGRAGAPRLPQGPRRRRHLVQPLVPEPDGRRRLRRAGLPRHRPPVRHARRGGGCSSRRRWPSASAPSSTSCRTTSRDQHPWFQAALAAGPGSPERERFWFHPGKGENGDEIPTHWVSSFQGETWTRTTNPDGTPGEWYLHMFTPEQPDLNWNHPDVRREHEDILRFWFDRGVAGVRIDSAALLIKDADLPEVGEKHGPGQHPTEDRDELHDVYRSWRAIADSYPGTRVLVGEIWVPDIERFTRYLRPDEMHTAFNFDFLARPWGAASFRDSIERDARGARAGRRPEHVGAQQPRRHAAGHPVRPRRHRVRLPEEALRRAHRPRARPAPGARGGAAGRGASRAASTSIRATSWASPRSRTCRSS